MFEKGSRSTRRDFVKGMGAVAATTALLGQGALSAHAASSQHREPDQKSRAAVNILLVHGAFVGASSWSKVIPLLQARGFNVLAVQNPLTSLQDDVETTTRALASLAGPTLLVGHSYGGNVISNSGTQASNAVGLVYIAAYAPEQGESVLDINGKFPAPPAAAHFVPSYRDGFVWIDPPAFGANFVQDIPQIESRGLSVAQNPSASVCFEAPSGVPAWKRLPSWYLVSGNDRAIQPAAERFMARRIGATTREIPSSHASPVSHPYEVASLILHAATTVR